MLGLTAIVATWQLLSVVFVAQDSPVEPPVPSSSRAFHVWPWPKMLRADVVHFFVGLQSGSNGASGHARRGRGRVSPIPAVSAPYEPGFSVASRQRQAR